MRDEHDRKELTAVEVARETPEQQSARLRWTRPTLQRLPLEETAAYSSYALVPRDDTKPGL